nr:aldehyde dehydrogenase [uncultured bacterium]
MAHRYIPSSDALSRDATSRDWTHFVGNDWHDFEEGRIAVRAPAEGPVLGTIARGGASAVDQAVGAARKALCKGWGRTNPTERGRRLTALSRRVLEDLERRAWIDAADTGKPIGMARGDIRVLARYFESYGECADKIGGQVITFDPTYSVSVIREPHEVTAHIIPWNYPAQMFGRPVAPALAMGNAAIVKPAEDACLTVLEVACLAYEVSSPPGAFNIVTRYGHEAGAALTAHPHINYVSVTGSPAVGLPRVATSPSADVWVVPLDRNRMDRSALACPGLHLYRRPPRLSSRRCAKPAQHGGRCDVPGPAWCASGDQRHRNRARERRSGWTCNCGGTRLRMAPAYHASGRERLRKKNEH